MRKILCCVISFIFINGCTSTADKEILANFTFPVQPASDEIVIYVAKEPIYGSVWEYFSLELNGKYKILNGGDCNYFIVKGSVFTLRSKKNIEGYPVVKLIRSGLTLGQSYYFLQEGNGRNEERHFEEVTAKDIIPICAKYGFGRVMNNPPNARWGKNELKPEHK